MSHTAHAIQLEGRGLLVLVNVPVNVYSAAEDHDLHAHQVDKSDGTRIRYKRVRENNGDPTLLANTSPENVETGVVAKALLDAAGFNVTLENVPASQQSARLFSGDFEMIIGGLNPSDGDASASFLANFVPDGSTNISGVDDPELAEAARDLKSAATLDEQKAAFTRLHEVYNRVMPLTVFANAEEYVVVDESVKGVTPTVASTMLFHGAYTAP